MVRRDARRWAPRSAGLLRARWLAGHERPATQLEHIAAALTAAGRPNATKDPSRSPSDKATPIARSVRPRVSISRRPGRQAANERGYEHSVIPNRCKEAC